MKLLSFAIQNTPIQLPNQISNVTSQAGVFGVNIIKLGIDLLLFASALIVFAYVVFGGWKFLTSQGDKKAIEEARATIIWAIIGMIVIALSFLIINVIGTFFNVNLLKVG